MKMQFKVTFKRGPKTVAEVFGVEPIDTDRLTVTEMVEGVHDAEAFLEKLTGLRVHIEQVL